MSLTTPDDREHRDNIGRWLLETSPDCLTLLDKSGRLLFLSMTCMKQFGIEDVEVVRGVPWSSLWPDSVRPALGRSFDLALSGRISTFSATAPGRNAVPRNWMVTLNPLRAGTSAGIDRVIALCQDADEPLKSADAMSQLANIVSGSQDAIVSKDLNGIIRTWNEAACRIFGYSSSEAIGQSIRMLIPGSLQDEEVGILRRIRNGERIAHYETTRLHKNGSRIDVSLTVSPIITANGTIVGASKIARDITRRKSQERALRDSEARMRLATDATGIGLWEWDTSTDEIKWDHQLFKIYGIEPTPDGIVDFALWRNAVLDEDRAPSESALRDAIATGGESQREFCIRRRTDGALRHIQAVESVRQDADGRAWVTGTNRDITDLRQMQQALQQNDRRKDEFLATLAHELRNPLAPLRMGLTLLKRQSAIGGSTEQTHAMMERQLKQMSRLIEDLMDVSRISTGRLELRKETVSVNAIVGLAIETSQPLIDSRGHQLRVTMPAAGSLLDADATRMSQVIVNLLNNACKYTPIGGHIDVEVDSHEGFAHIRVRDDGIGIATEELPRIFELFAQSGRTSDSASTGLGIGLSLVRKVVELHDGTVVARSRGLGLGSEFEVRLPICQPAEDRDPVPVTGLGQHGTPSRSILIVDDNHDIADSLATILTTMGYETRVAYDGEQAVQLLEGFRPHAAVLDIGLPKLDGNDVCRFIRRQPWGSKTTVIAVTGLGQPSDRTKSREAGFNHYFVKPVDPQIIADMLPRPQE